MCVSDLLTFVLLFVHTSFVVILVQVLTIKLIKLLPLWRGHRLLLLICRLKGAYCALHFTWVDFMYFWYLIELTCGKIKKSRKFKKCASWIFNTRWIIDCNLFRSVMDLNWIKKILKIYLIYSNGSPSFRNSEAFRCSLLILFHLFESCCTHIN